MRILVLGGDGFCGWPASLHLSARGHDVIIADNLSRRRIDEELGASSLTPISEIQPRLDAWEQVSGRAIGFHELTVGKDYDTLVSLLLSSRPDAVVHFAEQRAAPYSMKSARHKRYTIDNNLNATNDILAAIVESGLDIHLAHLGTMGVYGYGSEGVAIPEGYLTVKIETSDGWADREILHPAYPGSIYHLTKAQDALLFQFYARNDRLRITDLHQGIVWGTQTEETRLDPRLVNRFDYDGDYGTVLNRFLMQAAVGYPLTVHGEGGQTRAFINIQDMVRCVELALNSPPARGDRVMVRNQMTECWKVRDLAQMVSRLTGAQIAHLPNPREESAQNGLLVCNTSLIDLGLQPITLEDSLLLEISEIARRFADRADLTKIPCASHWNADRARAVSASPE